MDLPTAYRHATQGPGVVVPLAGRGLLRLTGPQAEWFLQNTVTNHVEGLGEQSWVASCLLEPKGKVLAHFRVGAAGGAMWLDVDPPATPDLADRLARYRFRTKVEIADLSDGCIAVLGPRARDVASEGEMRVGEGSVVFGDTFRSSSGEVPFAVAHGTPPDLGLQVGPYDLYDVLRVEAGVGAFGVDYGPDTLPQEAGLTSELSVTKGCYVGQEVVARLHFRGHVNRVLRTLRFEGEVPAPGSGLSLGQRGVGRVTSGARSPALGAVGIGMVGVDVATSALLDVADGTKAVVGPVPIGTKTQATPPART